MKRNYMKPEGTLVSLNVNENVAASGLGPTMFDFIFGVKYRDKDKNDPNSPIYIATTDQLANDQSILDLNEKQSDFVDWLALLFYPEHFENCTYDPTV